MSKLGDFLESSAKCLASSSSHFQHTTPPPPLHWLFPLLSCSLFPPISSHYPPPVISILRKTTPMSLNYQCSKLLQYDQKHHPQPFPEFVPFSSTLSSLYSYCLFHPTGTELTGSPVIFLEPNCQASTTSKSYFLRSFNIFNLIVFLWVRWVTWSHPSMNPLPSLKDFHGDTIMVWFVILLHLSVYDNFSQHFHTIGLPLHCWSSSPSSVQYLHIFLQYLPYVTQYHLKHSTAKSALLIILSNLRPGFLSLLIIASASSECRPIISGQTPSACLS